MDLGLWRTWTFLIGDQEVTMTLGDMLGLRELLDAAIRDGQAAGTGVPAVPPDHRA